MSFSSMTSSITVIVPNYTVDVRAKYSPSSTKMAAGNCSAAYVFTRPRLTLRNGTLSLLRLGNLHNN